jgi:hypothetical protein
MGCHVQQIALGVVDLLQVSVVADRSSQAIAPPENSKPLARCMVPIEMCPLAVPAQHLLWELVAQFGTTSSSDLSVWPFVPFRSGTVSMSQTITLSMKITLYLFSQNVLEQMPVALLLIFIAVAHQCHVLRSAEPLQKT